MLILDIITHLARPTLGLFLCLGFIALIPALMDFFVDWGRDIDEIGR